MQLTRTDYLNLIKHIMKRNRYRMKLINDIFNLNKEVEW